MRITRSAPCKVNLTLDIGLPRGDGYHDLDSLVTPLSPADEIAVTLRPGTGLVKLIVKDRRPDAVAAEPMPRGPVNIAHHAGRLFSERFLPPGEYDVWITLGKRLPAQAGLGAGSSDAAAVLLALAEAVGKTDPVATLAPLAAAIGSDVALFLPGGAVRMQGRGERLLPLPAPLPTLWGIVVRPAEGVPTGPAFALLDALSGRLPGESTRRLLEALPESPSAETIAPLLHNDFEAAILPAFPAVRQAHEAVRDAGALRALLCGSGSAVFGLARDRSHAIELVKKLAGKLPWIKLAATLP